MFQSLNATGTPLTALETFKPLVVAKAAEDEGSYQGSKPEQHFAVIERVCDTKPTFPEKTKLTNEEIAMKILKDNGFTASSDMDEAVQKAVALAKGGKAA